MRVETSAAAKERNGLAAAALLAGETSLHDVIPLAANGGLGGNSRPGLATPCRPFTTGLDWAKPQAAPGVAAALAPESRRVTVIGRFLTPDWSDDPEPIPYANLTDPQSLNLYAYARNNPVTNTDPDGHLITFAAYQEFVEGKGSLSNFSSGWIAENSAANLDSYLETTIAPVQQQMALDRTAMAAEKSALALTSALLKEGIEREYGGLLIQSKAGGQITFTKPSRGTEQQFDPGSVDVPDGYTAVADYHTHPHTSPAEGEGASWGDVQYLQQSTVAYKLGYEADTVSNNVYRFTSSETYQGLAVGYGLMIGTVH